MITNSHKTDDVEAGGKEKVELYRPPPSPLCYCDDGIIIRYLERKTVLKIMTEMMKRCELCN